MLREDRPAKCEIPCYKLNLQINLFQFDNFQSVADIFQVFDITSDDNLLCSILGLTSSLLRLLIKIKRSQARHQINLQILCKCSLVRILRSDIEINTCLCSYDLVVRFHSIAFYFAGIIIRSLSIGTTTWKRNIIACKCSKYTCNYI